METGVHSNFDPVNKRLINMTLTIDPVCFHIGSRPVYWFGIMMALAFLAAMAHWSRFGRRLGREASFAGDLALWLMTGGIVGARTAYVVANWDYFRHAPGEIVRVDQGGIVFYGGLIGGAVALILLARRRKDSVLALADFTVSALPLGHALGRVGCFLNNCCHGRAAECPSIVTLGLDQYPVQLYEAVFNLALYGFLLRLALVRKTPLRPGTLLTAYLLLYPAGRFLLEFLRGDERIRLGSLDVAQYGSLGLMITGLILWIFIRRSHEHHNPRPS